MSTKTLSFGVSKTILTKVPRYFSSQQAILRELFQNSFRAKAESVKITYKENVLRFDDDGCGADAENFLIAGHSGWNEESEAVDPAGLGAFSFLRPEYVVSVVYRSRDWRMVICPSDLDAGKVDVEYGLAEARGMQVELHLTPQVKFADGDFKKARAQYPMNVVFEDSNGAKEIASSKILDIAHGTVPVPRAGWIDLGKRQGHRSAFDTYVIWQHASFGSSALDQVLSNAVAEIRNKQENKLAHAIISACTLVFHVDPISGIRPKLPDREELINDEHLREAAHRIVRAILDAYRSGFDMEAIERLPDTIEEKSVLTSTAKGETLSATQMLLSCAKGNSLAANLLAADNELRKTTFELFGYRLVDFDDPAQVSILTQDDGDGDYPLLENYYIDTKLYVRKGLVMEVSDEGLRTSLCAQGLHAIRPQNGQSKKAPKVQVSGLRHQEGDWVAFAEKLLVDGKPVRWIARSNPNTAWNCAELDGIDQAKKEQERSRWDQENLTLVVAIPPVRFLSDLNDQYTTWRGYVAWMFDDQGILGEITVYSNGEYEFDDTMIETNFKQAAIRWLDKQLVDVLERQMTIKVTLEKLWRAKSDMRLFISPKRKELISKAAVGLAFLAIRLAIHVLRSRSDAIDRQFQATVKKSL